MLDPDYRNVYQVIPPTPPTPALSPALTRNLHCIMLCNDDAQQKQWVFAFSRQILLRNRIHVVNVCNITVNVAQRQTERTISFKFVSCTLNDDSFKCTERWYLPDSGPDSEIFEI